ncbi:SRPBCC domain-containing protein [Streptomyces sp. DG2A-72]|uniref:SRPBCC domain-containing protein n=1 Tax=Streptomyces sp. DG2A-72 TaxID=3051386 RepID=UPI00265C60A6|nr:SRPBCC domain-containing protein [Streptomyces sp. DG2A-72]MDO0935052.1 SRPBCC domain-containing protein [Streptomyces sp. DG2A-72]
MEHEVFVPVPAERLREALADPARIARAVPGLQQDAGAEPVTGRLKVRVGGHTITYRGSARLSGQDDGSYAIEGDATEARGTGSVKLALTLRLRDTEGGTTLTFDGTATADGRVAELAGDAVTSAVGRLLNRFAENLGAEGEGPEESRGAEVEGTADAADAVVETPEESSVFDAEVPAPGLDPLAEAEEPAPAEAAHARRTMIGRSAEEVDHAPPRGRYAPVPAPQAVAPHSTLRWAAPAAALVLASAIVVGRVLRKRR